MKIFRNFLKLFDKVKNIEYNETQHSEQSNFFDKGDVDFLSIEIENFKKCILFDEGNGYFIAKRKHDTDWIVYKNHNYKVLNRVDFTFEYLPDDSGTEVYEQSTRFYSYGDALNGLQLYRSININRIMSK